MLNYEKKNDKYNKINYHNNYKILYVKQPLKKISKAMYKFIKSI